MPSLKVRVFATFRELLGTKSIEIEDPIGDVEDLINYIADRFQPSFRNALLDDKGHVRKGFSILVNGREITFLKGLETKLKDGDIVAIFPPIAGG
ncbi:MoaD family protein [Candidatus Bathyarchaeota archaeon]|nr:MoaD family protein [Candidatus Bathyarchaeota archaeon]MBS7627649.1 MoaD family protein [Candidatus Bathyarchaeota archaeon]